jgi:hypothetical protein
MSETFIKIIPSDPEFVPPKVFQAQALRLVMSLVGRRADLVTVTTSPEVEFVESSVDLKAAYCTGCNTQVDPGWWSVAVDQSYHSGHFNTLKVEMPCCGLVTTLNELRYDPPIGWAKFVLEAREPRRDITDEQLEILVHVLGTKLKKIT